MDAYDAREQIDLFISGNEYANPLLWWKEHQYLYPLLASLARQYLAAQATSAPSERVFSAAQRITNGRKNRIDPDMASKVHFVGRNWDWYYGQNRISMEEALDEIEVVIEVVTSEMKD